MKGLTRGVLACGLAIASATAVSISPASAAVAGGYSIYYHYGVAYQPGKANVLPMTGISDDVVVRMSTTSTGAKKLPFPISFYGTSYSTINVSSNGNIQFGTGTGTTAWTPTCLGTTTFSMPTMLVLWQDLVFDPSVGEGVFVQTSGTTGHKRLAISWRGRYTADNSYVRAEAVFTQGQTGFVTNYASWEGASATIGTQGTPSVYSQYQCAGDGHGESPGDQLAFSHY